MHAVIDRQGPEVTEPAEHLVIFQQESADPTFRALLALRSCNWLDIVAHSIWFAYEI